LLADRRKKYLSPFLRGKNERKSTCHFFEERKSTCHFLGDKDGRTEKRFY
jgi:hypothetical protein